MEYDYNTKRKKMVLPEYGRNIQKMVDYVVSIKDHEERNKAARTVINVMGNMNPHLRDVSDFKHKLWDHLAMISNFQLDIDFPYELPSAEVLYEKPRPVPYGFHNIKYKHYGKSVEMFIEKALEMKDDKKRNAFIEVIANHMKKSYLTWNREVVTDQQIFIDLEELSGGRLKVPANVKLLDSKEILSKNKKKRSSRKK